MGDITMLERPERKEANSLNLKSLPNDDLLLSTTAALTARAVVKTTIKRVTKAQFKRCRHPPDFKLKHICHEMPPLCNPTSNASDVVAYTYDSDSDSNFSLLKTNNFCVDCPTSRSSIPLSTIGMLNDRYNLIRNQKSSRQTHRLLPAADQRTSENCSDSFVIEKNIKRSAEIQCRSCKSENVFVSATQNARKQSSNPFWNATSSVVKISSLRRSSHQRYKSKNKHDCRRNLFILPSVIVSLLHQITSSYAIVSTSLVTNTTICKQRYNSSISSNASVQRTKLRPQPTLGATSFLTLLTLVCLETVLLSTMSTCAKTFYMHWNTSNSIFRIDNTDHIIDVNKGNLAFEFDQVHIICPVYEPGTFENETEKYIIYNVSKVEYETCRITNADPRVIAICDKPQKLMFFTITFRPFTPQPGGLEFLPGNDYYFISTSSKDDLYRRIGGRCSTNNMKVVFKVCCAPEEKIKTVAPPTAGPGANNGVGGAVDTSGSNTGVVDNSAVNVDTNPPTKVNQVGGSIGTGHHINNININSMNVGGLLPLGGGVQLKPINGMGTSINTNIDQFNRIPIQPNVMGGAGSTSGVEGILLSSSHGGINMLSPGRVGVNIAQYPGNHHHVQSGIRINNVPTQQNYPSHKSNSNDDASHHYDKHPNEVVKNEELTYNSAATSLIRPQSQSWFSAIEAARRKTLLLSPNLLEATSKRSLLCSLWEFVSINVFWYTNCIISNVKPLLLLTLLSLAVIDHQNMYRYGYGLRRFQRGHSRSRLRIVDR